jgi:hypothetical protein
MPTTDELQAQIDALTARIVSLETRLAAYDAREQGIQDLYAHGAAAAAVTARAPQTP